MLTLFADEAVRWNQKIADGATLSVVRREGGRVVDTIVGNPSMIGNADNIDEVMKDVNCVILCVPAFAHAQYFNVSQSALYSDGIRIVFFCTGAKKLSETGYDYLRSSIKSRF